MLGYILFSVCVSDDCSYYLSYDAAKKHKDIEISQNTDSNDLTFSGLHIWRGWKGFYVRFGNF